jgi:hypothetical protein
VLWQDCITVRSFLLVARHNDDYHPHPTRPMPTWLRDLRDHLGLRHYGASYDPTTGVVRKTQQLVRDASLDAERARTDPAVALYASLNPGHVHGDGLLQLLPFTLTSFLRSAWHVYARVGRHRPTAARRHDAPAR